MVKTLQKKFIIASMLAVSILLTILIGAINLLNRISVSERQERMLEMLCEMDGHPGRHFNGGALGGNEGDPGEMTGEEESGQGLLLPRDRQEGIRGLFLRRFSMDDALGARYFAVWFDSGGEILRTDVSQIYAVTEEEAASTARQIYSSGKTSGTSGSFRYMLCAPRAEDRALGLQSEAAWILVAMDISGDRQDLVSVLGISVIIALICWAAMLIPVHALARLAIAPTALSIERQKQFVTNAGHELKTPLAIIQANTDAIELYTGASKWTRNIRTQTVRLNGLMQNLLTLSRMDESSLQLELKPFLPEEVAKEVWENFAEPAAARKLTFALEAGKEDSGEEKGEERGLQALGNRDSIAQLFSILYDNAVKYTPRGGHIRMRIFRDGQEICMEQSNGLAPETGDGGDGKGGIPEDPDRLFERFYRTDSDRSRKKGGYGIGLSAARAIAGANRGTIHASVRDGRIFFTVRLSRV